MKNRSRPDIIATILEASNGGITKTRLLLKANLTSGQLKQYMQALLPKKLIVEMVDIDAKHTAYRTTELGMRYLAMYDSLKSIAVFPQDQAIRRST